VQTLLHETFGQFHEGSFEVEFFFAEEEELEAFLNQLGRDFAVVEDSVLQGDQQDAVLVFGDGFDGGHLFEEFGSFGLVGGDPDIQDDRLADLLHDLIDLAVDEEDSLFDHADLITDVGKLRKNVAGDDDGLVEFAKPLKQVADFDADAGVETAGRFVEEENLRFVEEYAGEADALRLTAGELIDHRIALVGHVDEFEFFFADLAAVRTVDAVGRGEEFEVFNDLHVIIDAEEVGHIADESADFLRMGIDRFSADVGFAVIGIEEGGQHAHGRGLTRSVRTDEAEDVPLSERQVEIVDGDQIAVAFCQLAGLNHGKVPFVSRGVSGNYDSML